MTHLAKKDDIDPDYPFFNDVTVLHDTAINVTGLTLI